MNSKEKLQATAKFAGWAYFLIIITSVLSIVFGPYKLMAKGDTAKTIDNILQNEFLFRAGIVYEILMYSGVIFLSVALFKILKHIGKGRAIAALLFRFAEALMGFFTVLASILTLYIINSSNSGVANINYVELLFEIKDALMKMIMIFIGIGSVLFFQLFYQSGYIPRWLSLAGIVIFALIFTESIVRMLYPMSAWMFPGALAILFEIVVALWLIVRGLNLE